MGALWRETGLPSALPFSGSVCTVTLTLFRAALARADLPIARAFFYPLDCCVDTCQRTPLVLLRTRRAFSRKARRRKSLCETPSFAAAACHVSTSSAQRRIDLSLSGFFVSTRVVFMRYILIYDSVQVQEVVARRMEIAGGSGSK